MIRVLALLLACASVDAAALVARNSSGFTTATTWGVSEAGSGAEQLVRTSNTDTTTSYVYAAASFTVTLTDSIEGLLLRCKRLNSTGTVTVTLSPDGGVTPGEEVVVNATDLTLTDDTWVFFKFATPMTGLGTATYRVGIKGSSAANATFYRDGTAANWTRILRTAATQVPVAADSFYIAGECTAAATCNTLTVTLDETATTDYGLIDIGQRGVATAGVVAATAYNLKISGDLNVWAGGTLSLGTVGTVVPTGSSFKLQFDCGSNVQYGLTVNNQGTFISQGAVKIVRALLAADAAGGATALTTDVSTGWLNGDEIAIPSTTRTFSQAEKKTMGANAAGTSIGTIAALANAHSGTAPARADLANLTRNVQIFGASASLQTYVLFTATAIVDVDYTEFYWMGSGTLLKRGVDVATTTGTVDIQYSSFHNFEAGASIAIYLSALTSGTFNAAHNVGYFNDAHHFRTAVLTSTTWTLDDNLFIRNTSDQSMYIDGTAGTVTNNTVASSAATGWWYSPNGINAGTFSGNTAYSCASFGFYIAASASNPVLWTNTTSWRNNNWGISTAGSNRQYPLTYDGVIAFGNVDYNIRVFGAFYNVYNNVTLNGDTTFATAFGIGFDLGGSYPYVTLNNSNLGVASGILVAHSVADLTVALASSVTSVTGSNNILASASQVLALDNQTLAVTIGLNKMGGVAGANKTWTKGAGTGLSTRETDSVIFNTATPSQRLTPSTVVPLSTIKFPSSLKTVALASGATTTISAWVRKSSSGDAGGANYNGAEPRLMIQTNPSAGIGTGATDVVCDTMTAGLATWEQLTCTTGAVTEDTVLAAYVDLDGTAGWVNVDDWSVTNPQFTGAEKYWFNGGTALTVASNTSGGGACSYVAQAGWNVTPFMAVAPTPDTVTQ